MTALWFAVAFEPPAGAKVGTLWSMNVRGNHLKSPSPRADVFALRRTYVFQPFHIDKRIAAQAGWFSVHKYAESSDQFVPLDKNKTYKTLLNRYYIPVEDFPNIRNELRRMGVTQAILFPDLAGLSADIEVEFLGRRKDAEAI